MALFEKIYGDGEVISAVRGHINANFAQAAKYAKLLLKNKWTSLGKKSPIFILSSLALCLNTAYERFAVKGLSEEIFFDTMSDIKIWCEDCRAHSGELGLKEINWLILHVNCRIFKIGRLQYQIGKYYFSPQASDGNSKIRLGDKCFFIHIPRGGKLDVDDCVKSINSAVKILGKTFPDIQTNVMACHSWLLASCNKHFIAEDSNIAKFAKLFTIVGENPSASEHLRWIFDIIADEKTLERNKKSLGYYYDLSDFLPKNSLQTRAKDYVMSGGELRDGKGVLFVKNNNQS